jgi:cysteine synthase B
MSAEQSNLAFPLGSEPAPTITQLVGGTPLVRIRRIGASFADIEIYAKLEYFNPGGSVKDRAALQMVLDALADRRLTPDKTLIDSTSGNTGVAYSWIGAALGFRVALVMPANVSLARKRITSAYGAQIIFSDPMEGSDGAIRKVQRLVEEQPDRYFYPDQYSNESNPRAHYLTTGEEIWKQTRGQVTHFVGGIGTGGTVMGTGRRLKDYRREIQVIAVEPAEALHGLEGLKHMPSSIVPAIYREGELDEKMSVSTDEGWEMADRLLAEEGLLVGRSAGAAMVGASRVAQRVAAEKKKATIVTLFPDRGDRYFEPVPPRGR